MNCCAAAALRLLVSEIAAISRGQAAVVLCVVVGEGGVATDAGGLEVGTNVPAHVVTGIIIISVGTLHVVVADDLTLSFGGVGVTVIGTLVVTRL